MPVGPQQELSKQKEKINRLVADLSRISMTEEWAKYAKLQRKINSEKEVLEKLGKPQRFHKSCVMSLPD